VSQGETRVLDRNARLLLRHVAGDRNFRGFLTSAQREDDGGSPLLPAARGRILLENDVGGDCLVIPRLALLGGKAGLLQDRGGVLIGLANDVWQNSIVRQYLRRKRKKENRGVGN